MAAQRRCVVLGGGLAGLSAAIALLDAGHQVTLIERRPFLGGRAYSFVDQETGQEVDNGQHVFLGCCTEYRSFLRRLGVQDKTTLQKHFSIPVYMGPNRKSTLAASPWLPAPLHALPSFLTYKHFSFRDRLNTMRVMLHVMRVDRTKQRDVLAAQSFYDWLRAHGEHEVAIERFWNLVILPTLNDDIKSVSALMGLMVFQESLFRGRDGANVGYSRVGLTALISDAAKAILTQRGGSLALGHGVTGLRMADGRVRSVEMVEGTIVEGDVFVSAVPWDALPKLLPEPWSQHASFQAPAGLESAPIVGIHIWYDRKVMREEFAVFLDSPVQWVFDKSRIQRSTGDGQYLCISLSGAWEYAPLPKEELQRMFVREMARLFPRANDAKVERFIVVKQLGATFRSKPGAEALRPAQQSPIPNLFLAGDWTQTGWPSTMESAVRSGRLAAQAVARFVALSDPAPTKAAS